MEKTEKMGSVPVGRLMLSMSVPMVISMILQAVYNIVDSTFVSNMAENGEAALNALTLAFPLQMLNMLMEAGMRQSMSRVGRCIDNGPMKGFWGILKSEMYYLRKFSSKEEITTAIEDYIEFYNTRRYQLKLKCMTPMEYHSAAAA